MTIKLKFNIHVTFKAMQHEGSQPIHIYCEGVPGKNFHSIPPAPTMGGIGPRPRCFEKFCRVHANQAQSMDAHHQAITIAPASRFP